MYLTSIIFVMLRQNSLLRVSFDYHINDTWSWDPDQSSFILNLTVNDILSFFICCDVERTIAAIYNMMEMSSVTITSFKLALASSFLEQ